MAAKTNYESSTSSSETPSRENITSLDEALRVLDRAIIENKNELKQRLSSDFQDLKSSLSEFIPRLGNSVREYGGEAMDSAREWSREGTQKAKQVASQFDTHVRANPWAYIGGVALGSMALGFATGRMLYYESES
jgi:ElaB/YqjD/DUF883 family membrane-anchored ribosome-binding protein